MKSMTKKEINFLNKKYNNAIWYYQTTRSNLDIMNEIISNGSFYLDLIKKDINELLEMMPVKLRNCNNQIKREDAINFCVKNELYKYLCIKSEDGRGSEKNNTRIKYFIQQTKNKELNK